VGKNQVRLKHLITKNLYHDIEPSDHLQTHKENPFLLFPLMKNIPKKMLSQKELGPNQSPKRNKELALLTILICKLFLPLTKETPQTQKENR